MFDGAYTNSTMFKYLSATFDKTKDDDINFCIKNPYTNDPIYIYIFCDAGHMLKLVRNTIEDLKCVYDGNGQLIKWKHREIKKKNKMKI